MKNYIKVVIWLLPLYFSLPVFGCVKTTQSTDVIIEQIRKSYGITVLRTEVINLGVENDTYFLKANDNKEYILRIYRNPSIKRAQEEAVLLRILAQDIELDHTTIDVLSNNNAQYITSVGSNIFALFPYIKGKHPETLTKTQLRNILKIVQLIHAKGAQYTDLFNNRPIESIQSVDLFFYNLLKKKIIGIQEYCNILFINYSFFNSLNKYSYKTTIHRDIHKGNIIVDESGKLHLIDFDDFIVGTPALELSVIIRGVAFIKESFDLERARIIIKNYSISATDTKFNSLDIYNMILYDLVRVIKGRLSKFGEDNKQAKMEEIYNRILLLQKHKKEFIKAMMYP